MRCPCTASSAQKLDWECRPTRDSVTHWHGLAPESCTLTSALGAGLQTDIHLTQTLCHARRQRSNYGAQSIWNAFKKTIDNSASTNTACLKGAELRGQRKVAVQHPILYLTAAQACGGRTASRSMRLFRWGAASSAIRGARFAAGVYCDRGSAARLTSGSLERELRPEGAAAAGASALLSAGGAGMLLTTCTTPGAVRAITHWVLIERTQRVLSWSTPSNGAPHLDITHALI